MCWVCNHILSYPRPSERRRFSQMWKQPVSLQEALYLEEGWDVFLRMHGAMFVSAIWHIPLGNSQSSSQRHILDISRNHNTHSAEEWLFYPMFSHLFRQIQKNFYFKFLWLMRKTVQFLMCLLYTLCLFLIIRDRQSENTKNEKVYTIFTLYNIPTSYR